MPCYAMCYFSSRSAVRLFAQSVSSKRGGCPLLMTHAVTWRYAKCATGIDSDAATISTPPRQLTPPPNHKCGARLQPEAQCSLRRGCLAGGVGDCGCRSSAKFTKAQLTESLRDDKEMASMADTKILPLSDIYNIYVVLRSTYLYH